MLLSSVWTWAHPPQTSDSENASLKSKILELEHQNDKLKDVNAYLRRSCSTNATAAGQAQNKLDTALYDAEGLRLELSETQERLSETQDQLSSTRDTLSSTQANLTSTHDKLTYTRDRFISTKATLSIANHTITTLHATLATQIAHTTRLETTFVHERIKAYALVHDVRTTCAASIDALKRELTAEEAASQANADDAARLRGKNAALKSSNEALQIHNEALLERNDALEESLAAEKRYAEEWMGELETLRGVARDVRPDWGYETDVDEDGWENGDQYEVIWDEGVREDGVQDEGVQNEGIYDEGMYDEGAAWDEGVQEEGTQDEAAHDEGAWNEEGDEAGSEEQGYASVDAGESSGSDDGFVNVVWTEPRERFEVVSSFTDDEKSESDTQEEEEGEEREWGEDDE